MRRLILPAVIAACLLSPHLGAQGRNANRPNVIFIMSDDHAAHAIGAYGSKVNTTPHLDRLAREGALLTNVFATNSICTPISRAGLAGRAVRLTRSLQHRGAADLRGNET